VNFDAGDLRVRWDTSLAISFRLCVHSHGRGGACAPRGSWGNTAPPPARFAPRVAGQYGAHIFAPPEKHGDPSHRYRKSASVPTEALSRGSTLLQNALGHPALNAL
jgi:hypothetical protein